MESLITIVAGFLSIAQILWLILLPRISRAFAYLNGPAVKQADLNWKLTETQIASGFNIYVQHLFFKCYGQEPLDNDLIDRHPSVTYDDTVTILEVEPSDPRKIKPHIEQEDHKITVKARWNSGDPFGIDVILVSKEHPQSPTIDARFVGVKEITSWLVTMRVGDWITRLWLRFGPASGLALLIAYVVIYSFNRSGVSAPPFDILRSVIYGIELGVLFLVLVMIPMMLIELLVISTRAMRKSNLLSRKLRARRSNAPNVDGAKLQEHSSNVPTSRPPAVTQPQALSHTHEKQAIK